MNENRFSRVPVDFSEDHAPEPTPEDLARNAFMQTAWPDAAFEQWLGFRKDLVDRTGITWKGLHTPPACTDSASFDALYPETPTNDPSVLIMGHKTTANLWRAVYADRARLYWNKSRPVGLLYVSTVGDALMDKDSEWKRPHCLFILSDATATPGVKEALHKLVGTYIYSQKPVVIVELASGISGKSHMPNIIGTTYHTV